MVEQVDLSPNAIARSLGMARAVQYAAGIVGDINGWVLPTAHAHNDLGLAFDATHSGASLNVDIEGGIGFVAGKHLRTDVTTQVTLAGETADQTVYLGWPTSAGDTIIVGLAADFPAAHEKLALWTFDTDASGVTAATDERKLEYPGADLGDGTEIGRALFTALTETAAGTPGDSENEIFRVAGTTSDLILAMDGSEGRFNLAYNAYYDGTTWRSIVADQAAFRLRMTNTSGRVQLMTAQGTTNADDALAWEAFAVGPEGDLFVYPDGAGAQSRFLYDIDNDVVPKVRLGGPASSLTTYPLPNQDINDGPGSGLDADTLDGVHLEDMSGEWDLVTTSFDSNAGTVTDFNTGFIGPQYDLYRVEVLLESTAGTQSNEFNMRVNGWSGGYYQLSRHSDVEFIRRPNQNQWYDIAPTDGERVAHAVMHVAGPLHQAEADVALSVKGAGQYNQPTILQGNLDINTNQIDNFRLWTARNAQTVIAIHGKNF